MMDRISHSESNFESVYLVGVSLSPSSPGPDLYTVVLYNEVARGDSNRPLTVGGSILFSLSASGAVDSLGLGDAAFRKYTPFHGEVSYIYDVPQVLELILKADSDGPGLIADFINELLDFVAATPFEMPEHYRHLLGGLADVTTFDRSFGQYMSEAPGRRNETRDALLWCIGAVASASQVRS